MSGEWHGTGGYAVQTCICDDGPYIGARQAGMVDRCETCGFITREQLDAIIATAQTESVSSSVLEVAYTRYAQHLARKWVEENRCFFCGGTPGGMTQTVDPPIDIVDVCTDCTLNDRGVGFQSYLEIGRRVARGEG